MMTLVWFVRCSGRLVGLDILKGLSAPLGSRTRWVWYTVSMGGVVGRSIGLQLPNKSMAFEHERIESIYHQVCGARRLCSRKICGVQLRHSMTLSSLLRNRPRGLTGELRHVPRTTVGEAAVFRRNMAVSVVRNHTSVRCVEMTATIGITVPMQARPPRHRIPWITHSGTMGHREAPPCWAWNLSTTHDFL
jgi:hypothetical protein